MAKSKKRESKGVDRKLIWIVAGVLVIAAIAVGIFLLTNTNNSGKGELTNQQLRAELNRTLSMSSRIAIYPSTRLIEITQEDSGWVGIGIKNVVSAKSFSYSVSLSKVSGCSVGISKTIAESWITAGITANNLTIPSGDFSAEKVYLKIPAGAPTCIIRYGIYVKADGTSYANNFFDVKINAKTQ